jgi:hypothetical protein
MRSLEYLFAQAPSSAWRHTWFSPILTLKSGTLNMRNYTKGIFSTLLLGCRFHNPRVWPLLLVFRVVPFQRCTEAVDSSGIRLFCSHSANLARGSQVSSLALALALGSWLLALSSLARPLTEKEAVAGIRVRRRWLSLFGCSVGGIIQSELLQQSNRLRLITC